MDTISTSVRRFLLYTNRPSASPVIGCIFAGPGEATACAQEISVSFFLLPIPLWGWWRPEINISWSTILHLHVENETKVYIISYLLCVEAAPVVLPGRVTLLVLSVLGWNDGRLLGLSRAEAPAPLEGLSWPKIPSLFECGCIL